MPPASAQQPLEVVVAGAGVAGLEAVIALRSLAGDRVRIKLLAPGPDFVYRPAAVAEPFGLGQPHRYPLAAIAADFAVDLVADALTRVDSPGHGIETAAGEQIGYDALVLALGARQIPVWDHVVTFRGSQDAEAVKAVVAAVERDAVESVAFVVPAGVTWSLPLYELALMTAQRAGDAGREPQLVVYTPERAPLEAFGRPASEEVAGVLDRAGVALVRNVSTEVTPLGDLVIPFEETPLRFERVLALPRLEGPAVQGVPHDRHGFIPIDSHAAVEGTDDLYAAGDGTDYAIKQGGMAAAEADAAAELIARQAGVDIEPQPFEQTLRGKLLVGDDARFLLKDPAGGRGGASQASKTPLWWPGTKIAATHLAPYLAAQDAAAGEAR